MLKQKVKVSKLAAEIERLKTENSELRQALVVDDLTGLYNARHLKTRLNEALSAGFRDNEEPALLFLDIDHFKLVNERHGHRAAGLLLREVGDLIRNHIRDEDVAFRYGGDEFVILVSGGLDGASSAGERVRFAIERHVFEVSGFSGPDALGLTVSVGTRVMKNGDSAESVLEAADQAMFEAKRQSRNAVVAAV